MAAKKSKFTYEHKIGDKVSATLVGIGKTLTVEGEVTDTYRGGYLVKYEWAGSTMTDFFHADRVKAAPEVLNRDAGDVHEEQPQAAYVPQVGDVVQHISGETHRVQGVDNDLKRFIVHENEDTYPSQVKTWLMQDCMLISEAAPVSVEAARGEQVAALQRGQTGYVVNDGDVYAARVVSVRIDGGYDVKTTNPRYSIQTVASLFTTRDAALATTQLPHAESAPTADAQAAGVGVSIIGDDTDLIYNALEMLYTIGSHSQEQMARRAQTAFVAFTDAQAAEIAKLTSALQAANDEAARLRWALEASTPMLELVADKIANNRVVTHTDVHAIMRRAEVNRNLLTESEDATPE